MSGTALWDLGRRTYLLCSRERGRRDRDDFRRRYYPGVTARQWNDWYWQVRHRVRDLAGVQHLFDLTADEQEAISQGPGKLPIGLTPYYASLISPNDAADPLRKTVIPGRQEHIRADGEWCDPLGEERHSPVPGIVHTYPDKVLFLVTDVCATYCRYCTRSRRVGDGVATPVRSMWAGALDYLRSHPEVRDVLVSGGDPLVLSDDNLDWLLGRLRAIPHVEMLRIGTKIPMVMPQRITPALVKVLRAYHPLFFSIHCTHPAELTAESARACGRLADAGIPLGSQTVLLAGVNDDPATLKELMLGLLKIRVRPYYLHQCDAVAGSAHFRVPIARGQEIIRSLHGFTSGYAVPTYMLDAPGGGGKVPLTPSYVEGQENGSLRVRNYRGVSYTYPDAEKCTCMNQENV